ncbi:MAG: transposase [Thiohalomonas sp.]|nr:transposase [Thiohalomonas sp.]
MEFNYMPKDASWLNMVEIEIGNMNQWCLNRRMEDRGFLISELAAWKSQQNQEKATINWMFNVDGARTKLTGHMTS